MPQINDCIVASCRTILGVPEGALADLLLAYYQNYGATANDLAGAARQFLVGQGIDSGALPDMWDAFYTSKGYEGSRADKAYQYWCVDGGVPGGGGGFPSLNPTPNHVWYNWDDLISQVPVQAAATTAGATSLVDGAVVFPGNIESTLTMNLVAQPAALDWAFMFAFEFNGAANTPLYGCPSPALQGVIPSYAGTGFLAIQTGGTWRVTGTPAPVNTRSCLALRKRASVALLDVFLDGAFLESVITTNQSVPSGAMYHGFISGLGVGFAGKVFSTYAWQGIALTDQQLIDMTENGGPDA